MDQLVRLEEDFVTNLKLSIEMAPGYSHFCYSPCRNFLSIDPPKNELAGVPGLAKGPHLGSTSPASSCNPTPVPTLVPAPVPTLAAINELFK